jgi:hypothetical protein
MSPAVRLYLIKFSLCALPLAGLACGGEGGTDVVLPSLAVTTTTTGVELDPDGYSIVVDGQPAGSIGVQATLAFSRLAAGQHTVELLGVAANCVLGGENPRAVDVADGSTATVEFAIVCSAGTGGVRIATATGGTGGDPDGFTLLLDGGDRGPIGPSATTTVSGLPAGSHTVGLAGVAVNCQVAGDNPRPVTVTAGATSEVSFAITCTAPGPTTGTLEISVSTSGANQDPDGYTLLLDGSESGPIGLNATTPLAGVPAGSHSVGLAGIAVNCRVAGDNPRPVIVPAGEMARASFSITCTAPSPTTGTLEISVSTTGANPDPDGYQLSVDGGASQPIGTNATVTLANVSAAEHAVRLLGLASNCAVTGDNPVGAAVPAGGTARIAFAVSCLATAGRLTVTISGLPAGAQAAVTVTGPGNFSRAVPATTTLSGLTPGTYSVAASNVVVGGTTYTPSISRPTVDVVAGATAAVTASYTAVAAITLNLRVDGLYLTQSTQTYSSGVPLVAGRAAMLRVFVVANEANTARPRVRVQLFSNGTLTDTRTIEAPQGAVPTSLNEGELSRSWNLPVDASLIQPGLSVAAEVDVDDTIKESNEGDNRFPASGRKSVVVRAVPAAAIRFVSVLQTSNNLQGAVGSPDGLTSLARRLYPLRSVQTSTRSAVLSVNGPLLPNDVNSWGQVLSDLDGARVADPDGSSWTYYGIVKLNYGRQDGIVGQAFQGIPLAIGWDDPSDAARVVAHELGHTWGRRHSPCGGPDPATLDNLYPYQGGQIGVYGMDLDRGELKPPTTPDIMGYCFAGPWLSDYTYRNVMEFRESNPVGSAVSAVPQLSLLVWGRVVDGRPVLEPGFQIVTRPKLPKRPGPYTVSAMAPDGSRLITLSFDVAAADEGTTGDGHFAFAVPLDQAHALRLGSLRLDGPGGSVSSLPPMAQLGTGPLLESIVARREGDNVSLRWDASTHPMIMVRDPDTGEVLSFARGGTALVRTAKNELELNVSDGVRSHRLRLAINRS